MLKLINISKSYKNIIALNKFNLSINTGQRIVLVGPSGCGKSTLIRLMVGLVRPDLGDVYFKNIKLTNRNIMHVRLKMGYVIQSGGLFPHLSAKDNISLMPKQQKWSSEKLNLRIEE